MFATRRIRVLVLCNDCASTTAFALRTSMAVTDKISHMLVHSTDPILL